MMWFLLGHLDRRTRRCSGLTFVGRFLTGGFGTR